MIHYTMFLVCLLVGIATGWLLYGIMQVFDRGSSYNRLIDALVELNDARRAREAAEQDAGNQRRTVQNLQYELDQRNGWNAGDEVDSVLAPYAPPVGLTLLEEYQPHVIEWLPFSLN